jgi:quercetin dioxygenase-like cupin family protein
MTLREAAAPPTFVQSHKVPSVYRSSDHGGQGTIAFRRLLDHGAFASAIDFVDFSVIPSGSTIGRHEHVGTEEIYAVFSGTPQVTVNGETRRLARGDIAVVRAGEWHELVNDCDEPVEIFVFQVHV